MAADGLSDVFNRFCAFGAGSRGAAEIDGAKFAKLCKDCKVIDKRCTRTEVDMVFTRAKTKGTRKLNFSQFQNALEMLAVKKFPRDTPEVAYDRLVNVIVGGRGPVSNDTVGGVGGTAAAATDRLTDTTGYTGSHKERFNADGTGRGADGRSTRVANDGYVGNYQGQGTYGGGEGSPSSHGIGAGIGAAGGGNMYGSSNNSIASRTSPGASRGAREGYVSGSAVGKSGKKSSRADDITARLTDSSGYTGAHKQRFNADGTGRGASGRTEAAGSSDGYVGNYKGKGTYGR